MPTSEIWANLNAKRSHEFWKLSLSYSQMLKGHWAFWKLSIWKLGEFCKPKYPWICGEFVNQIGKSKLDSCWHLAQTPNNKDNSLEFLHKILFGAKVSFSGLGLTRWRLSASFYPSVGKKTYKKRDLITLLGFSLSKINPLFKPL